MSGGSSYNVYGILCRVRSEWHKADVGQTRTLTMTVATKVEVKSVMAMVTRHRLKFPSFLIPHQPHTTPTALNGGDGMIEEAIAEDYQHFEK